MLASLPADVRAAIEAKDPQALQTALQTMTPEQQQAFANQLLAGLPPTVSAAIQAHDGQALQQAVEALPPEEQMVIIDQLRTLGILGDAGASSEQDLLDQFDPLLHDIAIVARGEPGPRAEIEKFLEQLATRGWHLNVLVPRIWNGERDADTLTEGLDEQETILVERILELIESPELANAPDPDEQQKIEKAMQVIASLPEPLRNALTSGNMEAFMEAMEKLPREQAEAIMQRLAEAGMIGGAEQDDEALDPKEVLNTLPFEVRMAVEARDIQGLQMALAKLPPAQAQAIVETLGRAGLVGTQPKQEKLDPKQVINSLPFAVRMAVEARDVNGLRAELAKLPPAQAQEIAQKLRAAGLA